MNTNRQLLDLPTKELLKKIGVGNHKPGSGSAAALNGIISCKLLLTVILLTLDPKRKKRYGAYAQECTRIQTEINNRINPRLEELFQEDSMQFDRAIIKRKERDSEQIQARKNELDEEALSELIQSTELPLEIANLTMELANFALYVFDKGYKAARGDSGVALSSALSSITGCLSIVSLNLHSFARNSWTIEIVKQRSALRMEYDNLLLENSKRMDELDNEAILKSEFLAEILEIRKTLFGKTKLTYNEIEQLARRIQNTLWSYREIAWINETPTNLLDVLRPDKMINLLKYAFDEVITLGVNDSNEEIAGLIDNTKRAIYISGMFLPQVRNFTAAHELGHALLHDQLVLHRDIPLDGSEILGSRPIEEKQADKFATYFLMPEKLVRQTFMELFQSDQFVLNDNTSFALASISKGELMKRVGNLRELSRMLASTTLYASIPFRSLASIFKVSAEAMAIRLEELELVKLE